MNHKKKDTTRAKCILLILLVLALIVPNLIGTTTVTEEKEDTAVRLLSDITGKTLVSLDDETAKSLLADRFPDCKVLTADSLDAMANAVIDGNAFALAASAEDKNTLAENYPELKAMPGVLLGTSSSTPEEWYYVMVNEANAGFTTTTKTVEDANQKGATIACLVGTTFADKLPEMFPNAEIQYYNTNADMNTAVSTGKADFGQWYSSNIEEIVTSFPNMATVGDTVYYEMACFALPKTDRGEQLRDEFNRFMSDIEASGELSRIERKWAYGAPESYALDYSYTGENGTLKVVTCGTWNPNSFYADGVLTGKYIELICAFCSQYGYTPEISVADYGAELAGITTGVYDIMADVVSETPERAEEVNLTTPVYCTAYCLTTIGEAQETKTVSKASNFVNSIKSSFTKTFITENRWQMILSGLGLTIAMALLAAIIGTLLGAAICAMRMSKSVFADAFAQLYIKIIQGMPIVILLLVLYYLVFGKSGVSAFWVCVIGFSLDFAAYCSEIFRTGIESIPAGQIRAARALGFSSSKAFMKVVFPQALVRILPVYNGQLISMVKLTSVAGYISVMDLTKVSDLIRSRTFEAFFPLITTAVIYFLISAILIVFLRQVERKVDPALRSRTVKGVNEHD